MELVYSAFFLRVFSEAKGCYVGGPFEGSKHPSL